MVETYEPKPLKERKSQRVGFSHYLREIAPIIGLAVAGAAAGWGAAKARVVKSTPMVSAIVGGKVTAVISAFLIWRKKEKMLAGIEEMHQSLKSVDDMHLTNDDLHRDNKMLTQMIDFERRREAKLSGSFTERVADEAGRSDVITR